MKNEKQCIFKSNDIYCVTPISNYYARTQDARKIHAMRGFNSPNEIIEYYCRYFNSKENDFIIME